MIQSPSRPSPFPRLSESELQYLSTRGEEVRLEAGDLLFQEGAPADHFYVLLEGQVKITKKVGGEETVLTVHNRPGEFTGELSLLATGSLNIASGHALTPSRLLKIETRDLKEVMMSCSTMMDIILSAMTQRVKDAESWMQQREKMAALGKLSAGLAHELNNPASAGRRSAAHLRQALQLQQAACLKLSCANLPPSQQEVLAALVKEGAASMTLPLDPLARSDREEELGAWLEDHEVPDAWDLAPTLVRAGIGPTRMEGLAGLLSPSGLADALAWAAYTLEVVGLVEEVEHSTTRISDLVKAIKDYSYMDQAPLQEVDLHEGLENTLIILGYRMKQGIQVTREYSPGIPHLWAYGSELNQVWTNLLDNAVDAMEGKGELRIRTAPENGSILVEITDTGPGIPEEVLPRIFDPFFTTKGVGQGTGLGLDIVHRIVVVRHHGDIHVLSRPGGATFQVRLPVRPPK